MTLPRPLQSWINSVQSPSSSTLVSPTVVPSSSASETPKAAAASRIPFLGLFALKSFQASLRLALVLGKVVVCIILSKFKFVCYSFCQYLTDDDQLIRIRIFDYFNRMAECLFKIF